MTDGTVALITALVIMGVLAAGAAINALLNHRHDRRKRP